MRFAAMSSVAIVCSLAISACAVLGQSVPAGGDRFDVASIHRGSDTPEFIDAKFLPGGRFQATNMHLKSLIALAWNVRDEQVSGAPGWVETENFTISAEGAAPTPGSNESETDIGRRRLQSLLAERFGLIVRHETRDVQGYVLVVARGGVRMQKSELQESHGVRFAGPSEAIAAGVEMDLIRRVFSVLLTRPVVDETALAGRYDFHLRWTKVPGETNPGFSEDARNQSGDGPSLFTAIQEQLGLRLESRKVPADAIVVDRVERPTEN